MDLKPQNLLLHVKASGKYILKVGGTYICMCMYVVCMHVHACMYLCMYVCTVCMHVCMCVCVYVCICIYASIFT